jgi:hypothetical protein
MPTPKQMEKLSAAAAVGRNAPSAQPTGPAEGPDNPRLPYASHDPRGDAEHRAIIAEAKPIMRRSSLKPG